MLLAVIMANYDLQEIKSYIIYNFG